MTTPAVESRAIPRRAPSAAWRDIDGETILLDTKGRMMRGLNATAGAAWKLVDGERFVEQIARAIALSAGADEGRVLADVVAFFTRLFEVGLIELPRVA